MWYNATMQGQDGTTGGIVVERHPRPMRPLSLFQRLLDALGQESVQYPARCGVCDTETKGNTLTGYTMGCQHG